MGPSSRRLIPSCTASPGVLVELNESCGNEAPLDAQAPNALMIASFAAGVAATSVGSRVMIVAPGDQRSFTPDGVVLRPARPETMLRSGSLACCMLERQT